MKNLDSINEHFQMVRNFLSKSVAAPDRAALGTVLAARDTNWKTMQEALAAYATEVRTSDDKADLDKLKSLIADYEAQVSAPTVRAVQAGDTKAAIAVSYSPEVGKLTNELNERIELIIKKNVEDAERIASANANLANASATMMTIAAVLGVVLAVVLGLAVTKVIRGQVGGEPRKAAEVTSRVAKGDLNVQIHVAAGDTTSIGAALAGMIQALSGVVADIQRVVVAAGHGDFDQRIETAGTEGYIRDLGTALNELSGTCKAGLSDVMQVMEASAQGDLTRRITQAHEGDFGRLKDATNTTLDKLSGTIAEVNQASKNLLTASEQVSSTAQALSQGASEQSASVEETSASMEEMSASISQNNENAKVTGDIATSHRPGDPVRRRSRAGDRLGHEADRPQDRHHRRHRLPDQPAGAERGHRGGPGRGTRQGLRGGGGRGAQAGRAQPGGRRGDQPAGRWQRRPGRSGRKTAGRHRALHPEDRRSGPGDRRRILGAELRGGRRTRNSQCW